MLLYIAGYSLEQQRRLLQYMLPLAKCMYDLGRGRLTIANPLLCSYPLLKVLLVMVTKRGGGGPNTSVSDELSTYNLLDILLHQINNRLAKVIFSGILQISSIQGT